MTKPEQPLATVWLVSADKGDGIPYTYTRHNDLAGQMQVTVAQIEGGASLFSLGVGDSLHIHPNGGRGFLLVCGAGEPADVNASVDDGQTVLQEGHWMALDTRKPPASYRFTVHQPNCE